MDSNYLREALAAKADGGNKKFNEGLTFTSYPVMGVRVPDIVSLAKQAAKINPSAAIDMQPRTLEELMLKGATIAFADMSEEKRIEFFDTYIDLVDDWEGCDIVFTKYVSRSDLYYAALVRWLNSPSPFRARCGMVGLMKNFVDSSHIPAILDMLREIDYSHYYVMMGGAWLLSVIYLKDKEGVISLICDSALDKKLRLKTISKLRDSFRVSAEDKAMLKQLASQIKLG
ncbi:MAG: DNA alkylation repair protein [Clostridia bacterium]|nr:DNA alkylation repair protein [Clostridia bacterium]